MTRDSEEYKQNSSCSGNELVIKYCIGIIYVEIELERALPRQGG